MSPRDYKIHDGLEILATIIARNYVHGLIALDRDMPLEDNPETNDIADESIGGNETGNIDFYSHRTFGVINVSQ